MKIRGCNKALAWALTQASCIGNWTHLMLHGQLQVRLHCGVCWKGGKTKHIQHATTNWHTFKLQTTMQVRLAGVHVIPSSDKKESYHFIIAIFLLVWFQNNQKLLQTSVAAHHKWILEMCFVVYFRSIEYCTMKIIKWFIKYYYKVPKSHWWYAHSYKYINLLLIVIISLTFSWSIHLNLLFLLYCFDLFICCFAQTVILSLNHDFTN